MPSPRIYIGIDPGKNGGIAWLTGRKVQTVKMPATERDIWDLINSLSSGNAQAVIEWIHPAIQGIGKSPMSKLYGNYMQLRGFLRAADISSEDIKTAKWCQGLGIPKRKRISTALGLKDVESDTQWKNRLKAKAQELFPHVTITLATADALLIAEFCRRKHRGLV